jgi:putative hydrolase of the HAD superfamily
VHPEGTLYPDVQPFLQALHGSVRIGVLANQEAVVVDALRRDGIADYIDVWGVSALVGYEKPSPELFAWALAEAGTRRPSRSTSATASTPTCVRPRRWGWAPCG